MPDRVIRDELLESDRWLDLPSDTHRLVYENLILLADDYGNIKGGPRRLYRWMHRFTQIKSEIDAIKLMSELQDADMVLRYEYENVEFFHIARFKNSRHYWVRKWPQSPYKDDITIEEKQRPTEKRNTHVINPLVTRSEGVGVGVGVLKPPLKPPPVKRLRKNKTSMPSGFCISDAVRKWSEENGHRDIEAHIEHFRGYAIANGKQYADWDQALRNAIRGDWAKLNDGGSNGRRTGQADWWTTEHGTIEQGKQVGISSRAGESWTEFRQRIRNAMQLQRSRNAVP